MIDGHVVGVGSVLLSEIRDRKADGQKCKHIKRSWKQHLSVVERWGKNIQLNAASGKNGL